MSKTVLLRVTALAVLCLAFTAPSGVLGSCVQFSTQTVRVHVDAERDRLDLQLIYRDLHAEGGGTRGAVDQLERLRDGARWFAVFSNWPFMLNLEQMLANPPEAGTPGAALLAAVDGHLEVRPGELWVDDAGELCGSQLVRLTQLDDFVAAVNEYTLETLADPGMRKALLQGMGITDPQSMERVSDAVARGDAFVLRRGASFVFRMPVTDQGARQCFRQVLRATCADYGAELAGSPGTWNADGTPRGAPTPMTDDASELERGLLHLAANDWSIARRRGALEFSLGDRDADVWVLETPDGMGLPSNTRAELPPVLREAGWEILGPEHEAALAARWRAFLEER